MKNFLVRALIFLFFCSSVSPLQSHHTIGTATADSYTFDKLLEKFNVILVKFDDLFPFGEKHDEFRNLADHIGATKNFLLVEILLVENDEKQNGQLGKEFGVRKENYPVYRLFLNGKRKPIPYDGDKTEEDLRNFILKYASLQFSLLGTVDELNPIAHEFYLSLTNQTEGNPENLFKLTRRMVAKFDYPKEKRRGEIYVRLMETVLKSGPKSIKKEQNRIKNLLTEKITTEKKNQLQQRLNILLSFNPVKQKNRYGRDANTTHFINLDDLPDA